MTIDILQQRVAGLMHKPELFEETALQVFHYQARHNKTYRTYLNLLHKNPETIKTLQDIPFLPISFFKTQQVTTGATTPAHFFQSSGTTNAIRSKHYVNDLDWYFRNAEAIFSYFYGPVNRFCFWALLPSYLEQQHSSLVAMMNYFISKSSCPESQFFLNDFQLLKNLIDTTNKPAVLLGVSYALMDFADFYRKKLPASVIVMETGGMKGRRQELTKQELHQYLSSIFSTAIHSEYGMTELLSQAYAKENGIFETPPQMRVMIRDRYDPFSYLPVGKTGGINIIDLANIESCSFIETEDLGRLIDDTHFELAGRFEESDIRGCNLLLND